MASTNSINKDTDMKFPEFKSQHALIDYAYNYLTEEERKTVRKIAMLAAHDLRMSTEMDLYAVHALHGLDLDRMLEASTSEETAMKYSVMHDFVGIQTNLDRNTGEILNCFVPRFTKTGMSFDEATANIGKRVVVLNGEKKPPKHHKKKVREWENKNFDGILTEVNPAKQYGREMASIETSRSAMMIVNRSGYSLSQIRLERGAANG